MSKWNGTPSLPEIDDDPMPTDCGWLDQLINGALVTLGD